MKIIKNIFLVIPLLIGIYIGLFILPFRMSEQKNVDSWSLNGLYNPDENEGLFHNAKIPIPYFPPRKTRMLNQNILGIQSDNKHIFVDLTNQKLYAYDGLTKVFDFSISSGKWGRTPTGEFTIWVKLKYAKMEGGNKTLNTYYYLPNVPYVMYFYNDEIPKYRGYGIHGAYWHNNFGHPMSHGCINMDPIEAEKIFYWTTPELNGKTSMYASTNNPGTKITIFGVAPKD